ncbi:MAG: tRNA threonylcarbamoyladenosine dehydratase [Peptostreptococcaceae bacterium]|nr:tRNA threonylcarbamoyladenosine dehydratase [Peptostreptococcaceae bacterium]
MEQFFRTELLLGEQAMQKLSQSHVAIFGVGGVGSFATEAIARSGVGEITLVDFDTIDISNINRQLPALLSTVGKSKVEMMAARIRDIDPHIQIHIKDQKYMPENSDEFFGERSFDFVVDAIDIITAKLFLIQTCKQKNIPIISSMGMGNKIDPTRITLTKLSKTHMDPLAKVMRKELKDRGIVDLDVVFSDEKPRKPKQSIASQGKRELPASCAFVPPVAGLMMASFVIRELTGEL